MSLAAAIDLLACPRCGAPLTLAGQVRCGNGHAYDVAKHGYVNLSGRPPPPNADTAAMVAVRADFLAGGHYDGIAAAIAAALPPVAVTVLDAGAGTGFYAARVLVDDPARSVRTEQPVRSARRGIALDVSAAACRRAARAHPRLAAVVADVWQPLPVRDGVMDAVLSVFAPRQAGEFARVLSPNGVLVTVTPAPEHLAELRTELGLLEHQSDKGEQLSRRLGDHFRAEDDQQFVWRQSWDAPTARRAVLMGPNAFHQDPAALDEHLARLRWPRTVTVSVRIDRWRPRD